MFSSLRCCIEVEVLLAGCAIYRPIDTLSVSMPTQIMTAAGATAVVLETTRAEDSTSRTRCPPTAPTALSIGHRTDGHQCSACNGYDDTTREDGIVASSRASHGRRVIGK